MCNASNVEEVASDFQCSNLISQLKNLSQAQYSTMYTGICPGQQELLENQSSVYSRISSCVFQMQLSLGWTSADRGSQCSALQAVPGAAELQQVHLQLSCLHSRGGGGDPKLWAVSAVLQPGSYNMLEGKCWKV